jgi:HD-like signal output (HDOD) protein
MIARLFDRLLSRPAANDARASAGRPGVRGPVGHHEQADAALLDVWSAAGADRVAIAALLRGELALRCDGLRSVLGGDDAAGRQGTQLLDRLTDASRPTLQQPVFAAQRALEVCRDPESGIIDVVRLLEQDPTLTPAVLRYANSAIFAGSAPCLALGDAVSRIGTKGVQIVVLSTMVEALLARPGVALHPMVDEIWSHMVRTAPIARRIAPVFGISGDEAFVLGLLHDIGKLVLFDHIADMRDALGQEVELTPLQLQLLLGRLHEPLGGLALLDWGLGEFAIRTIATHHRAVPPRTADAFTEVVFLAERTDIARARGKPLDVERWWREGDLATSFAAVGREVEGRLREGFGR